VLLSISGAVTRATTKRALCQRLRMSWRSCLSCRRLVATAHFHASQHPLIRSFEPGEDWWWCYLDEIGFEIPDGPAAPSYA
jgi:hypothetical protein